MLEVNEFLVLDYVRDHDPTTRTDIGRSLGLSARRSAASSVACATTGWSRRRGRDVRWADVRARSSRSAGMPPRSSRSTWAARAARRRWPTSPGPCWPATSGRPGRRADAFSTLVAAIEAMRQEAARLDVPVVALAIGVPGILDPETGAARDAPYVDWDEFPVVDRLALAIDIPFVVDNDVNLAALAHAWRGDGRLVDDSRHVLGRHGHRRSHRFDGRLLKGRHNAAGELQPGRPAGTPGARSPRASGRSSPSAWARPRGPRRQSSSPADGPPSCAARRITPEAVLGAAVTGDETALCAVRRAPGRPGHGDRRPHLCVDPDRVILEGGIGRIPRPYLAELVARIQPSVPSMPDVVVVHLDRDATVIVPLAAASSCPAPDRRRRGVMRARSASPECRAMPTEAALAATDPAP